MKELKSGRGPGIRGCATENGFARLGLVLAAAAVALFVLWGGKHSYAGQEGSTGSMAPPNNGQLHPASPQVKGGPHDGEWWRIPDDNTKLVVPEQDYIRFPLPPGEEKYADVKGEDIKKIELEVVAISEQSKADGNQLWGRIAGTKYDHMAAEWVQARFKKIGLEVHQEQQNLPPRWMATSWQASVAMNGKTTPLTSAMPIPNSAGTTKGALEVEPVWVGEGYASDFEGRDLHGKAALIYSWPTPGGQDSTMIWNGALKRSKDAGAALVVMILGFPGNGTNFPPVTPPADVPSIVISYDEGTALRQAMEAGLHPKIKLNLNVEIQSGLKTETTWGVLPGATDEKIIFLAHHDAYFDGAMDNASGMALLQYIAARYAAMPKSQRRRTMVFMDTPLHHVETLKSPPVGVGARWLLDNVDTLFPNTVMVVNCEHTAETQFDMFGAGIMSTNTVVAHPFFVDGSEAYKKLVMDSFREFGVAVYRVREPSPGGELGATQFYAKFPSFHVINREFYHTTLDTADWTPAAGMEEVARAYLKILDGTNQMSRSDIWGNFKSRVNSGN